MGRLDMSSTLTMSRVPDRTGEPTRTSSGGEKAQDPPRSNIVRISPEMARLSIGKMSCISTLLERAGNTRDESWTSRWIGLVGKGRECRGLATRRIAERRYPNEARIRPLGMFNPVEIGLRPRDGFKEPFSVVMIDV